MALCLAQSPAYDPADTCEGLILESPDRAIPTCICALPEGHPGPHAWAGLLWAARKAEVLSAIAGTGEYVGQYVETCGGPGGHLMLRITHGVPAGVA